MAGSKEWGEEDQVGKPVDALARCLPLAHLSQLGVINETKFSFFPHRVLLGYPGWRRLWSGFLLFSQLKCSSSDEEGVWLDYFCCLQQHLHFLSLSAASCAPSPVSLPLSPCCTSGNRPKIGRMLQISGLLKATFLFEAGLFFQPVPVCC